MRRVLAALVLLFAVLTLASVLGRGGGKSSTIVPSLAAPSGAGGVASAAAAGHTSASTPAGGAPLTLRAHGSSFELSSILNVSAPAPPEPRPAPGPGIEPLPPVQPGPPVADGALQTSAIDASPSVSFTFDGLGNDDNNALTGFVVNPPDVSGDVGPSHYVETLNSILAVYNRSGAKVLGPVLLKSLWQGFAGSPPCKTHNDGDPVVLYDQISNRWVITQFSLQFFSDHVVTDECVAVSKNGDPTGAYWIYDFAISPTLFADYPKLGVWPDGYYLTFNDFADNGPSYSFVGVSAVVLERSKMLTGAVPIAWKFDTSYPTDPAFTVLPADYDGRRLPPGKAPNVMLDEETNALGVREFHADFANTANMSFTKVATLSVPAFDDNMCNFVRNCIPQKNTTNKLDAVSGRLMHRLAYRNNGSYQSLVVAHTVDTGGDHAGVRWYELRKTGSNAWTVNQASTFNPDATHRWMPSAAMDGNQNIAVGYSASSATLFPGIRYAARLRTDPSNTLQTEATMFAGAGSQLTGLFSGDGSNRWGDYTTMSVDPVDDCTFWYANEDYPASSNYAWDTRVGTFRFPSCIGISSFSPGSALPGTQVTINGVGFSAKPQIKFGGLVSPSVTLVSPTQVKAVVPDGVQPAQISAILGGNTGLSATNFKPTLSIFSFSPLSGTAGATVTIKGIGFNASSRVKFAGASPVAPVTFSASTLTVTVPAAAATGKISVTNTTAPVGTVTSVQSFTRT